MSRKIVQWGVAALAVLVAGTAAAAEEQLVAEPYPAQPAWKFVMDEVSPQGVRVREHIPADQQIDSYRDILAEQSMPLPAEVTPAQLLKSIAARTLQSCDGVRVNGPFEKTEAGVQVAYIQIYCGRQKTKDFGVSMFMKALRGEKYVHLVNREMRVPPSETGGVMSFSKEKAQEGLALMAAQGVANSYLEKSVYLCGGASTDPRCATGK